MGKIAKLLEDELYFANCTECNKQGDSGACDGCNNKTHNWGLSEKAALELEDKILKLM